MSKRELEQLNGASEVDGPRTKRRREAAFSVCPRVDVVDSDPAVPGAEVVVGEGAGVGKDSIQEEGLKLWQTVKDAVNKECVQPQLPFWTLNINQI